jgi:hypothetical protein
LKRISRIGNFEYEDNNNLVVNFKIKDSENHGGGD